MATNFTNKNISSIQINGENFNLKSVPFHATETEWLSINYIPKQGENVVYDIDDAHNYLRFKTGDGNNLVKDLPFSLITVSEMEKKINSSLNSAGHLKRVIIEAGEALPDIEDADVDTIYMKLAYDSLLAPNIYEEYMVINGAWELIGNTNVDLSDYATQEYVDDSIDAIAQDTFGAVFYENLSQAITDINNDVSTNAVEDLSLAKVKVFTADNGTLTVMLLDNISESAIIDINRDINLILNGKTLEFTGNNSYLNFNTGTSCNINGEIDGSKIIKNIENLTANSTVQAILGNGEKLTVKGGSYFIIGNVSHNLMTFKVGGTNSLFELDNCIIKATNTDEVFRTGICSARAIQSMAAKTIIKNSDIQSDAINECDAIKSTNFTVDSCMVSAITRNSKQNTAAYGVHNHGNSVIINSKIHSDAPFDGRDANLSRSMGISNEENGILLIENTDVTASYYAAYLKQNSKTYVKDGIFTGYSCGGFFFHQGQNGESYIKDAVIRCGNYDGIFDYSGNVTSDSGYKVSPFISFQVGNDYGKTYLDGCTIGEPGYTSFLINGQNNEVNISNSTVVNDTKPITIYNATNKLNIGINTNITTSIITAPSYANFTDKLYRKLHKDEICNGNDFNTFVNFLNSQINKTTVSDDGNGNVMISGLSTASIGQGG